MRRAAVLLTALVFCASCSEPPQKEIDRAQGAIDAARAAGAEQYASAELNEATTALQQAHEAVEQRDYRLALARALDAHDRAQAAARQAADGKARARSEAERTLAFVERSLQQIRAVLEKAQKARVPARDLRPAQAAAASAEGALQEARAALKKEAYLEAAAALKGTQQGLTEQIAAVNELIEARPTRRRR